MAFDGNEYSKPLYDMIVFFAGAYSCKGSMIFVEETIDQLGNDLSSCVPLYVDKIPQIDKFDGSMTII